ncbi:MAG: DNA polymerase III subunit delta' [Bacteroidia bacterium]|nr:MAG: DNA polymerase III subunit delta' [Bacteroidia bacterium]
MLWHKIPDLESLKLYLTELFVRQQIPHALLFKGEEGGAALPLALGYMQLLYCDNPHNNFPCGICKSCKQTENLFYPGFHFVLPKFSQSTQKSEGSEDSDLLKIFYSIFKENIFLTFDDVLKDAKGKNKQAFISVQEVHQIIESVSYSAIGNKYNIVCIWNPEYMQPAAANKLLKTLEEPPPQTLFFLICSRPEELLATILSRVQKIEVPKFNDKDVVDYLIINYQVEPSKAQEIAMICQGNINKAIQILLHYDEYIALLDDFREFARLAIKYDVNGIEQWMRNYESAGREAFKRFLEYALDILHYAIMQNYQLPQLIRTTQHEKAFISKFYPYVHFNNMEKLYDLFNTAYNNVSRNTNLRITMSELFLRCNELLKKNTTNVKN